MGPHSSFRLLGSRRLRKGTRGSLGGDGKRSGADCAVENLAAGLACRGRAHGFGLCLCLCLGLAVCRGCIGGGADARAAGWGWNGRAVEPGEWDGRRNFQDPCWWMGVVLGLALVRERGVVLCRVWVRREREGIDRSLGPGYKSETFTSMITFLRTLVRSDESNSDVLVVS